MRYIIPDAAIEALGEALYGPNWRRALSRDLGVSDMSLRRWTTYQNAIPEAAVRRMLALVSARQEALEEVRLALEKSIRSQAA